MTVELLHSPRLRRGDRVRLVSPASYPNPTLVEDYVEVLTSWGLRGEVGEHCFDEWGYMAGTDADRLYDLNQAFRDPEIRAVLATRGGAGAYRIADGIDFEAVRADPKPLIGFSDITFLHLAILHRCRVGAIHGCLVGPTALSSVLQLLTTTDPITLNRDPNAVSGDIQIPGRASGPLVGGNLDAVATSVGVRMPSMSDAILFLESQRKVGLGTVDRQITQLIQSGALDGVVGVALGSFEGFGGYSDRGWTLTEVLTDRLGLLGVPVLGGFFAGHDLTTPNGDHDQSAIPLGSSATLDTTTGTLTIDPIVS